MSTRYPHDERVVEVQRNTSSLRMIERIEEFRTMWMRKRSVICVFFTRAGLRFVSPGKRINARGEFPTVPRQRLEGGAVE